ncbi:MAG TPA: class I SAM-dependent methyltransferase, partial [Rhodocyclaceae bacterium]|nr:class I SAM-dependent methyltransferase [Rhodocyclaceae bacterium]
CTVLDLGCGDGHLLQRLAAARPDCRYTGIEHAPLPWLLAKLRHLRRPNVTIRYGNFWQLDLDAFDVVYAFLSPAPMPALADKVAAGMAPGKLLISNSFLVPGCVPDQVVAVDDRRQSRLFCYKTDLKTPSKLRN